MCLIIANAQWILMFQLYQLKNLKCLVFYISHMIRRMQKLTLSVSQMTCTKIQLSTNIMHWHLQIKKKISIQVANSNNYLRICFRLASLLLLVVWSNPNEKKTKTQDSVKLFQISCFQHLLNKFLKCVLDCIKCYHTNFVSFCR